MKTVRLQKYLSEAGVASRRHSEDLILEGRVKVNNRVVTELGTKIDPGEDVVKVNQKVVKAVVKGILLFHKPKGVVTTMSDPEGRPTVADYLTKQYKSYFPVGRLDWDATGLVVFTNDGDLAQAMSHPSNSVRKVYHVKVKGAPPSTVLDKISRGVTLEDGKAVAKARFMKTEDDVTWIELTITEGRKHIIKRIMERVGYPVVKLRRVSHGPLELGKLQPGEIRKLADIEYVRVRNFVLLEKPLRQKKSAKPSNPIKSRPVSRTGGKPKR